MSERNILELSRAMVQRQIAADRRMARLNLRAWPGALRSIRDTFTFGPLPGEPFVMMTMPVSSGRWKLSIRGTVEMSAASGAESIVINVTATGGEGWTPRWAWQLGSVGIVAIPLHDEGECQIVDDEGVLTVEAYGTGVASVTFTDLTLFALPV